MSPNLKSENFKVVTGPSNIDGDVARVVKLPDGAGRIEYWENGVGWVEAPSGKFTPDEFMAGAGKPVSASDAATLGIPIEDLQEESDRRGICAKPYLVMIDPPGPFPTLEEWEQHLMEVKALPTNTPNRDQLVDQAEALPTNTLNRDQLVDQAEQMISRKRREDEMLSGQVAILDSTLKALSNPNQEATVRRVAQNAVEHVTCNVIRDLEQMTDTLSGDDSGLETTWDEICVQVQHQESIFWSAYDEIVRGIVSRFVDELSKNEKEAIWLQTDAGIDWSCEEPGVREPNPANQDEIVDYLVGDIYSKAADWSNERIDAYFARSYESD